MAVAAAGLVDVPDGVELDAAVALLADGRTATALVRAANVVAGERALVEAAAGGVGSLLVQLARNAGAVVVGAAGGAEKLELAKQLGATVLVDYRDPGWAAEVEGKLGGVDVVFDGVGGAVGRAAFELLGQGGRMLSFGLASGEFTPVDDREAEARGVIVRRGVPVGPVEPAQLTRVAIKEAAAGRLHPVIGQRFPLVDAVEAHRAMESRRTIGKTLLVVS